MSFSQEDKKKVTDFFGQLLLKFDKPVHYEKLRGHVSSADPIVRKYVFKECKGEKLLHYFQTRKNYYFVDFRDEVVLLNKNKCKNNSISKIDNFHKEEVIVRSGSSNKYSRSDSPSLIHESTSSSVNDVFVDVNTKESSEHKRATIEYFRCYLARVGEINLDNLEIRCLPDNIKFYIARFLNNDILLFFKNNPEIFQIDKKNSVSLTDFKSIGSPEELHNSSAFKAEEETFLQDNDTISVNNFVDCAEFFLNILKKKTLPLNYIGGYLSTASPEVKEYLKLNYPTFKDFLLDADKLFIFNDNAEVKVAKNGSKLLKNAKTLLKANISPNELKQLIYSHLKSEASEKQNFPSDKHPANSCSGVKDLEILNMVNSNDDNCPSPKHIKGKVEKLNTSAQENIPNVENSNEDNSHSPKHIKSKVEKRNTSAKENIPNIENTNEDNGHSPKHLKSKVEKRNTSAKENILNIENSNEDNGHSPKHLKSKVEKRNTSAKENILNIENSNEDNGHSPKHIKSKVKKLNTSTTENIPNIENSNEDNCLSPKYMKGKVKKRNASAKENNNIRNINVIKLLCNKTSEEKIKNESLHSKTVTANIYEEKKIKAKDQEIFVSGLNFAETPTDFNGSVFENNTRRNFIESVFTLQLLCLEIVEKEYILHLKYDYEVVKFFVETLGKLPGEMSNINSLRGTLGQASKDVISFMNKLYKSDKFRLFFEKHDEFDLKPQSPILKLSHSDKNHFKKKQELHQRFVNGKKVYDVHNLYSSDLHNTFIDLLGDLEKICCFLTNKSRCKLSRLNCKFSKTSPSMEKFCTLNSTVIEEKQTWKSFLSYFSCFDFPDGCIEFNPELNLDISYLKSTLSEFLQKLSKLSNFEESKQTYFDYLLDYLSVFKSEYSLKNIEELKSNIIKAVLERILSYGPLKYSGLPSVVDFELLHNLVLIKKDSQFFMQVLEENNLFLLSDGNISYRQQAVDFIQDSVLQNGMCLVDSADKNLNISENKTEFCETGDDISNVTLENSELNISPSFSKSEKYLNGKVDTISQRKCYPFIENDMFIHQEQNVKHDLNHESIAYDQTDVNENNDRRVQDANNLPNSLTNELTVMNQQTDNIFCDTAFSKQEDNISSSPHRITDETVKCVRNDSNENKVLENIQKNLSISNERSFNRSNKKYTCISNSDEEISNPRENLPIISTNSLSSLVLIKENSASEVSNKTTSYNVNNIDLNCVDSIVSAKNDYEKKNVPFVSTLVTNFAVDKLQNSHCDLEPYAALKKCISIENLIENSNSTISNEIISVSASNSKHNQNNEKLDQTEMPKTANESHTSATFSGSPMPEKDSVESDSESDNVQYNFDSNVLQPLQAKITLLTLDFCIAETVINDKKSLVFCQKSCFHCDLHTCCSDCFNSLSVGDNILCYIPPTEVTNCGYMCFAFMFHEEVKNKSIDREDCQKNIANLTTQVKNSCEKDRASASYRDMTCFQPDNEKNQTSPSVEIKLHSSVAQKDCHVPSIVQKSVTSKSTQVQLSVASQNTQTVESLPKTYCGIDKECQVECSLVSRMMSTEVECQTVIAGEVKSCRAVCEKACLTKLLTQSQNTQTISESFNQGSQTNFTGRVIPQYDTSSSECQTTLTGEITRTQDMDHLGAHGGYSSVAQNTFCDIACQTYSTGPIMMTKLHQID